MGRSRRIRRVSSSRYPNFISETIEQIAFEARDDQRVDKRSGVSQRFSISVLESAVSNAERRALITGETAIVPRISDIYAALPAMTGKMELEYEGEQIGAQRIARDLIKRACGVIFEGFFLGIDFSPAVQWFDQGNKLLLSDTASAEECVMLLESVPDLIDSTLVPLEFGKERQGNARFGMRIRSRGTVCTEQSIAERRRRFRSGDQGQTGPTRYDL